MFLFAPTTSRHVDTVDTYNTDVVHATAASCSATPVAAWPVERKTHPILRTGHATYHLLHYRYGGSKILNFTMTHVYTHVNDLL